MSPTSDSGHRRAHLILVAVAALAFVIAGGVSLYLLTNSVPRVPATVPTSPGWRNALGLADHGARQGAARGSVTVAGMGQHRTIDCNQTIDGNQTILSISGMKNTVTVTGHCASLSVSGMDNAVTVDSTDSTDSIDVSGFGNRVVFHIGEPRISNSGSGNNVDRR